MTDAVKVKWLLRGLKPSLVENVTMLQNETVDQLMCNLRKIERGLLYAKRRIKPSVSTTKYVNVRTTTEPEISSQVRCEQSDVISQLQAAVDLISSQMQRLMERLQDYPPPHPSPSSRKLEEIQRRFCPVYGAPSGKFAPHSSLHNQPADQAPVEQVACSEKGRSSPQYRINRIRTQQQVPLTLVDGCPKFRTRIFQREVQAVIDSGAPISIVNADYVPLERRKPADPLIYAGIMGTTACIRQMTHLSFRCGESVYTHPVAIVDAPCEGLILGCDFLEKYRARLEFERQQVVLSINDPGTPAATHTKPIQVQRPSTPRENSRKPRPPGQQKNWRENPRCVQAPQRVRETNAPAVPAKDRKLSRPSTSARTVFGIS